MERLLPINISNINPQLHPELSAFLAANTVAEMERLQNPLSASHNILSCDDLYEVASTVAICAALGKVEQLNVLLQHNEPAPAVLLSALVEAVRNSQLTTVNRLLAIDYVHNHLADEDIDLLCLAAGQGEPIIFNRLLEFPALRAMVATEDNSALSLAAEYGHLDIVNRLLEFPDVVANITADDNGSLRMASENGYLDIVDRLLEFEAVRLQIGADNHGALTMAAVYVQIPVVHRLLMLPEVFAYADMHEHELGVQHIRSFIQLQLDALELRRQAFAPAHMQAIFDIEEAEVPLFFYMLRNLIRRNDPGLDNAINSLMLPALRQRLHLPMANGEANELLRLALAVGNRPAVNTLLQLPQVNELARVNHFYRDEGRLDLRLLAANRESSMVALSSSERRMLESTQAYYQPRIDAQGGIVPVFQSFKTYLQQRYEEHPATLVINNIVQKLPFTWQAFNALNLDVESREIALKAYYQHDAHSAYRYLAKPNHWIAADALYVVVFESNPALRYSTFEAYIPTIATFWMAAQDADIPPVEDYTCEGRIDLFIKQIALIGRGHNWDETRVKTDAGGQPVLDPQEQVVREEYDDFKADKPSCYSGVNRRLFQGILGHPRFTQSTPQILKQELYELIRTHFNALFALKSAAEKAAINLALAEVFYNTNPAAPLLKDLDIPAALKQAWITALSSKYGGQFNDTPEFLQIINRTLAVGEDESHLSQLYQSYQLDSFVGPLPTPAVRDIEMGDNAVAVAAAAAAPQPKELPALKRKSFFTVKDNTCKKEDEKKDPDPDPDSDHKRQRGPGNPGLI